MHKSYQVIEEVLANTPNDQLVRLVYTSKATLLTKLMPAKTLASIEDVAIVNNKLRGLSGILCYGNGYFLQCVEGEKQAILSLLERLFCDKRHCDINIIETEEIASRNFIDWGMRSLLLEDWLWREIHQDYVNALSQYTPFYPSKWSDKRIHSFLQVINRTDIPFISNKRTALTSGDGLSVSYEDLYIPGLIAIFLSLLFYLY